MINKWKTWRILVFISAFLTLFISCSKNEILTADKVTITAADLDCESTPCATIDISIIEVSGTNSSNEINKNIEQHLIEILDLDETRTPSSLDKAIAAFNTTYARMKSEFPEELFTYEAMIDCNVNFKSSELLTIEADYYLFTGGAHGYEGVRFMHFNPKTGQEISTKNLFKNIKKASRLCENTFRQKNNIPKDQNINSTGFNFENDAFHLPENIGFEEDSLLLYYASYEINPYAMGSTILKIPLSDIKDQLVMDINE